MLPLHRRTPANLIMPEDLGTQSADQQCNAAPPISGRLSRPDVDTTAHYDLVIIGAGPAALAVISRILESRPAALYTEDEHRHLHFTHRQHTPALLPSRIANRSRILNARLKSRQKETQGSNAFCPCDGRIKILVIDKLGEGFMGLWRRNFHALRISHLRSPMFFHPDASDFDALIAYANRNGTAGEGTPDQVIEQIQRDLSSERHVAPSRVKGCRRRTKGKLSSSLERDELHEENRPGETSLPDLIEILGVVGKEKSKHKRKQQQHAAFDGATAKVNVNERDRRDYFTPSSELFESFTRELEQKYRVRSCDASDSHTWTSVSDFFERDGGDIHSSSRIESALETTSSNAEVGDDSNPVTTVKGIVKDLAWLDGSARTVQDDLGNHSPGFLLELSDGSNLQGHKDNAGSIISAKAVVSAVGFGGVPAIPSYLASPKTPSSPAHGPGWMHSSCLAIQPFPTPPTTSSHMLVVGGGLTSAQIVVRALSSGYTHVTLLTRGHLKSKHFDVDLGWVGRYSNYLKMQYWQTEDVQERLSMLRAARNGGSVTPTYAKVLARLQSLGKLEVRTHTTITSAEYDGRWRLNTRTSGVVGGRTDEIDADYLIVATGSKIDFGGLPFLTGLQRTHPVPLVGGMPVLTADLEYRRDVPLFVTGAYAGLQIGPAAGNLGGMRDSADRIANRLLELLSLPEPTPPNVAPLPQTHEAESEARDASAETRKQRSKTEEASEKASAFTHFNFDLLSIEA